MINKRNTALERSAKTLHWRAQNDANLTPSTDVDHYTQTPGSHERPLTYRFLEHINQDTERRQSKYKDPTVNKTEVLCHYCISLYVLMCITLPHPIPPDSDSATLMVIINHNKLPQKRGQPHTIGASRFHYSSTSTTLLLRCCHAGRNSVALSRASAALANFQGTTTTIKTRLRVVCADGDAAAT